MEHEEKDNQEKESQIERFTFILILGVMGLTAIVVIALMLGGG